MANLSGVVGRRGVVYLSETNYEGGSLDYLVSLGATMPAMPEPVR